MRIIWPKCVGTENILAEMFERKQRTEKNQRVEDLMQIVKIGYQFWNPRTIDTVCFYTLNWTMFSKKFITHRRKSHSIFYQEAVYLSEAPISDYYRI